MVKVRETAEKKRQRIASIPVTRSSREDEKAAARKVFDAYCEWRRARAVEIPQWSDELAEIAQSEAFKCAQAGELAHRVSITDEDMSHISDIGMYGWKPCGMPNILLWAESKGHRQMLQCNNGISRAAVGVCENEEGVWYIVLVYEFNWSNHTNDEDIHRILATSGC